MFGTSATSAPSGDALAVTGGTPVRTAAFPPWPVFGEDEIEAVVAGAAVGPGQLLDGRGRDGRSSTSSRPPSARRTRWRCPNGTGRARACPARARDRPGRRGGRDPHGRSWPPASAVVAGRRPAGGRRHRPVRPGAHRGHRGGGPDAADPGGDCGAPGRLARADGGVDVPGRPARPGGGRGLRPGARRAAGSAGRSERWGHVAAWSFCQDKILTTAGEGGAVTTGDEEIWRTVWERARTTARASPRCTSGRTRQGSGGCTSSFGTNSADDRGAGRAGPARTGPASEVVRTPARARGRAGRGPGRRAGPAGAGPAARTCGTRTTSTTRSSGLNASGAGMGPGRGDDRDRGGGCAVPAGCLRGDLPREGVERRRPARASAAGGAPNSARRR